MGYFDVLWSQTVDAARPIKRINIGFGNCCPRTSPRRTSSATRRPMETSGACADPHSRARQIREELPSQRSEPAHGGHRARTERTGGRTPCLATERRGASTRRGERSRSRPCHRPRRIRPARHARMQTGRERADGKAPGEPSRAVHALRSAHRLLRPGTRAGAHRGAAPRAHGGGGRGALPGDNQTKKGDLVRVTYYDRDGYVARTGIVSV